MKKQTTKQILEAEAKKYIETSQPKIKEILESATLSLLGLEKNYSNNYQIDHCNSRNSVLIDVFKSFALDEAKKIASSYKPTKEDIANFKEAFEREYKSQMSYVIRDLVKQKVQEDAKKEIKKINLDFKSTLEDVFNS